LPSDVDRQKTLEKPLRGMRRDALDEMLAQLERGGSLNPKAACLAVGYSERGLGAQVTQLMDDPRVQRELTGARAIAVESAGIGAGWVLDQLRTMWDVDLADLFDENGNLLPIHELPLDAQKLVDSFEVKVTSVEREEYTDDDGYVLADETTVTSVAKVKLASRLKVLTQIGNHGDVDAFTSRDDQEAKKSLAELMRALARAAGDSAIDVTPPSKGT